MRPDPVSQRLQPYTTSRDRAFYIFNALLSAGALSFLAYILLLRRPEPTQGWNLGFLPAVNATLNGASAILLSAGYLFIRRRNQRLHKYCMVSAFVSSCLFLICYLLYHYTHGDTKFQGAGVIRGIYLGVLGSHVLLSMTIVPLAITSLYFAIQKSFARHRRIARITLPIWLYVSVTGVVIFWMLRGSRGPLP